MRKSIFLLLATLSYCIVNAQVNDINRYMSMHELDSCKSETGVIFNTFAASNSINNKFVNSLLNNQFIDNDLKRSNNIKENNYFGSEDIIGAYFIHLPDSFLNTNTFGYRISFENYNHRDMKFSDDFYNLVFYGNKQYAGNEADLSGFSSSMIKLQKFQFGIFKKSTMLTSKFTYYVGLSLIKGQSDHFIRFYDPTSLYTAETGEYIDFQVLMNYFGTDTVRSKFTDIKGIGGAANVFFAWENTSTDLTVSLSMNYMGLLRWFDNSFTIHLDSTYHYEGMEIEDILNLGEATFSSDMDMDSITEEFFNEADTSGFTRILPERMNLQVSKGFNDNILITAGATYLINANHPLPVFYAVSDIYYNKKVAYYLSVAYGGYSNFQFGLGLSAKLFKQYKLRLGSSNMLGMFLPEQYYCQNAYLSLSYNF